MVVLTLTDNADSTGVTAVISGGAALDDWEFFAGPVANAGPVPFTSYGTRTGDGTLPLATGLGNRLVYAINQGGARSPLVLGTASDGTRATATQFRRAVKAAIESLALPVSEIVEQWTPDETNLEFPCVVLTVDNVQETFEGELQLTEDIGYPVRVMICDKQDAYDHDALPDYELWREKVIDRFRNQQLTQPANHVICRVEFDAIVNPNLPKFMFMVSELIVRGICREPRVRNHG